MNSLFPSVGSSNGPQPSSLQEDGLSSISVLVSPSETPLSSIVSSSEDGGCHFIFVWISAKWASFLSVLHDAWSFCTGRAGSNQSEDSVENVSNSNLLESIVEILDDEVIDLDMDLIEVSEWSREHIDCAFIEKIQGIAPDRQHPLRSNGVVVWYDAYQQRAHIQIEEAFNLNTEEDKWSFSSTEDDVIAYWINGGAVADFPENLQELFEEREVWINEASDRAEVARDLSTRFNPDCLRLLYNFFTGPLGVSHCYRAGEAQSQRPVVYTVEDVEYTQWIRIDLEQLSGRSIYSFNFQELDQYNIATQTNKLGIRMDADGHVLDVRVDGQPVSAEHLFDAGAENVFSRDSIWGRRMTAIIDQFLFTRGFTIPQPIYNHYPYRSVQVHLLACARCPEQILAACCTSGRFEFFDAVSVLTDQFAVGQGIDAGGLRRQFMYELSRHLLDNDARRIVKMRNQMPCLVGSEQELAKQRIVLGQIGSAMAFCQASQPGNAQVIGRVFSDRFFDLLKLVLTYPQVDDLLIIRASEYLISNEQAWLYDIINTNRAVTDGEVNLLLDLEIIEDAEANISLAIKNYLIEQHQGYVQAAAAVMRGIPADQREIMRASATGALSEKVQGVAFDRQDIANRIVASQGSPPIVDQKVAWLKEFVLEQNEEWVKRLLVTITARDVVMANTQIQIGQGMQQSANCLAHTCFSRLDVPGTHSNSRKKNPPIG